MKDSKKTKNQLIEELEAMRGRLKKFERKKSEETLRESDKYLRDFMDYLQVPIQGYDTDGIVIYWNRASEQLYGYTVEEAIGRKLSDLIIPPAMQAHCRNALEASKKLTKSGEFFPAGEHELIRKDGRAIPVYATHTAVCRPGKPTMLFCIDIDLTELKYTEEELHRVRRDWEDIFQAIGQPAVILDKDHTIIEVNRATTKATEQSPQELIGKKCYEIFHGSDNSPAGCPLSAMLASGHMETVEMEIQVFGGVFLVSCTPVTDDQGRLQKIIHIATDVTERRQAGEALRRERDFNKRLIQASPAFIVSISPEGKTLMMNDAMLQALDYTEEEVLGTDYLSTFVPEADRQMLSDIFNRLVMHKEPTVNENRVLTKDGRELLVEWHGRQVFDERGNVEYFFGVGIDITERKRVEESLRESEEKYKSLFESSGDASFIMSVSEEDGVRFADCNNSTLALFGYAERSQIIGKRPEDFSPLRQPDGQLSSEKVRQLAIPTMAGNPQFFEWLHHRPDGTPFFVDVTLSRIDLKGKVLMQAVVRDITERKRMEEALRASEERFRTYSESSPMGVFETDKDGRVLYLNDRWCSITGLSREDALGFGWAKALHPEDKSGVLAEWAECLNKGKGYTGEFRFSMPTGETHWVFTKTSPIVSSAGKIIGHVGVNEDITERKRVEEALRFTQFSIDHTTEAAFWIGADARFVYTNEAACESLGYTRDEFLSMTVHDIDPNFPQEAWPAHWRELKAHRSLTFASCHRRRDGKIFPVEITANYLEYNGQEYNFAFARDITDRKRAEEAVRMAEVGKLASGLVHEVRNPLNAMRMQIAVIRSKLGHPDQKNINLAATQLERLEHEVLRVQELANDFLSYGRPASDHPETIELPQVISDVAEFIRPEFEQIGARVDVVIGDNIGRLAVRMDLSKLRQVLLNLAENARQAMVHGGHLRLTCDRPSKREARIQVRDTGCGIPPEQHLYVYDAFYSTKDEGTGLGLAIVKRTIEAVGGRVHMESEVDRGTCFEIYLPLASEVSSAQAGAEIEN